MRILKKDKKGIGFKLSDILPDKKQLTLRVLKRQIMAKIALWLIYAFEIKKVNLIYSRELASALGLDISYANRLLKQFASLNLLKFVRTPGSNLVYFEPVYNNKSLALLEFKEVAKSTLNVQ